MSRLAERIRNTEPWCVALLKAPMVGTSETGEILDFDKAHETKFVPLWEPGFVVQFGSFCSPEFAKCPYTGKTKRADPFTDTFITSFRQQGAHWTAEIYCETDRIMGLRWNPSAPFEIATLRFDPEESLMMAEWQLERVLVEELMKAGFEKDLIRRYFSSKLTVAMVSWANVLRLLQCKNVRLEERRNPLKRRSKGKNKRQVESYHVLNIPGSPRYWERSSSDGLSGIQHRLHVVRGHFRNYTEDRPHVSGWVGPMWISSHARGNADLGFADKDYSLTEATK